MAPKTALSAGTTYLIHTAEAFTDMIVPANTAKPRDDANAILVSANFPPFQHFPCVRHNTKK